MTVFEGALSEEAAALLGIRLGDVVPLGLDQTDPLARQGYAPQTRWAVRVVGLFRARDPATRSGTGRTASCARARGSSAVARDQRCPRAGGSAAYATDGGTGRSRGAPDALSLALVRRPGRISMARRRPAVGALRQTESIFPRASDHGGHPRGHAHDERPRRTAGRFTEPLVVRGHGHGDRAAGAAAMAMASLGHGGPARRRGDAARPSPRWRTRGASTPTGPAGDAGGGAHVRRAGSRSRDGPRDPAIPGPDRPRASPAGAVVLVVAVLAVGLLEIPPALAPKAGARDGTGRAGRRCPGSTARPRAGVSRWRSCWWSCASRRSCFAARTGGGRSAGGHGGGRR